jgi:very-short-patch-repair endonuclease/GNAT superfamily N-acetyltransferase
VGKTILNSGDIAEIIKLYCNGSIGTHGLATMFMVGHKKINKLLKEGHVQIKKRGAQITVGDSQRIEQSKTVRYNASDPTKILVAICKKTNKEFSDANNISGSLTRHIMEVYGDIPTPTNTYQRKKYELTTGKKWFEEYFDLIEVDREIARKCGLCEWETSDVENKTGCFEQHINSQHSMDIMTYLDLFTNEIKYHPKYNKIKHRSIKTNHVICKECGMMLGYVTSTHLKKHKMSLLDYKLKYPKEVILSKEYKTKLQVGYETHLRHHEPIFTTKPQLELYHHISDSGLIIKKNDKAVLGGIEIDLLIPEKKLGIEYNGLFYHKESMGKSRQYHLTKTKLMNDAGYSLIHIFEDEWLSNSDLITKKISHILGVSNSPSVGARKCVIKKISSEIKSDFLNRFHIQGSDRSEIAYGAYYNDELLAVVTFTNKRAMNGRVDDTIYELSRFATNDNYRVIGVAGRLISKFITEYKPTKIISFGDRRWVLDGNDNMYTKLGFKLVKVYPPDYKYYNPKIAKHKRLHKFGFGKSSIRKKFPELDFSKTEKELMVELGYDRIWDCGLFKYELSF